MAQPLPAEARDQARWTAALQEALAQLPHVARTVDVAWTVQGPFRRSTVWVTGTVWSDTDDDTVNRDLLADVVRAAAAVLPHLDVPSWVQLSVASASGDNLRLAALGLGERPTLADLHRF